MATKASTITQPGSNNSLKLIVWAALANGDDGTPLSFPDWSDRTVQISGTFGVGGTCVIEGSNDGVTYSTLTDSNGVALSITANSVKQINELPLFTRPRATGDGSTAIVVSVLARRVESIS